MTEMQKLDLSTGLAFFGIIVGIVFVVLDKAGKLKGPILLVALGVAALMALPLALGNSWVIGASGTLRFTRGMLMFFAIGLAYSCLAIWISTGDIPPKSANTLSNVTPPPLASVLPGGINSHEDATKSHGVVIPVVPEYPAVDFNIDTKKILTVTNRGHFPIDTIQMTTTEYTFDHEAFMGRKLKYANVMKISGPTLTIPEIGAEKSSIPRDLNKEPFLEFGDFLELIKAPNSDAWQKNYERYYALHFTFIDSATRKKYVFYKIMSGMKNSPSFIDSPNTVSVGGPVPDDWFMFDIAPKLIAHQKNLYGSEGLEEYIP